MLFGLPGRLAPRGPGPVAVRAANALRWPPGNNILRPPASPGAVGALLTFRSTGRWSR